VIATFVTCFQNIGTSSRRAARRKRRSARNRSS
jgi:hypothetical protein